jgi:tetratricopeptide (TPR) repeat protein
LYWTYFNISLRLGENLKAVESLQKALSIFPEDQKYVLMVKEYYDREGLDGLPKAVIQINSEKQESGIIGTARYFVFLGENQKALDYLEKAVELHIPGVPYINNDIDLAPLRNQPRFQALLDKMGLKSYQDIVPASSSNY